VHQHDRDAALRSEGQHRLVGRHAPDVVDQRGAGVERGRGDGRLRRVHAQRDVRQHVADGPDDGDDARDLVLGRDPFVPRARALAADVEEIGALGRHPARRTHGGADRVARREEAIARERIGRDVEDPHDERALAPRERPGADPGRGGDTG
jgi:hypothetical protein